MADNFDIVTSPETEVSSSLSAVGSSTAREFVRYFLASALALLVDAGSLYMLTSIFGVPYLYSGAIAFLLGLALVYILSIVWVFEHRTSKSVAYELTLFLLIGIIGLAINEGVLWILTGYLGLFYLISKAASVIVVFTWNFFARKYFLF